MAESYAALLLILGTLFGLMPAVCLTIVLVKLTVREIKRGYYKAAHAIEDRVEENKRKVQHWFFSTDLTFYIKGGRVTKTAGFVGTMLSICPLLHVNYEGKLIPVQKVRTKKKVIEAIEKKMEELAENGLAYDGKCYISHSACQADAEAVASLVESRFPNLNGRVLINSIGTTIGSHTGPNTIGIFFVGKER